MSTFARFITDHLDDIVEEFGDFARQSGMGAAKLSRADLEDHSRVFLEAVAADMATRQNDAAQRSKSFGKERREDFSGVRRTALLHARHRLHQGFSLPQMVSEYRALRAAVLRRWTGQPDAGSHELAELVRFGEAIDEGMTAALAWYSERLEHSRNLLIGILAHDLRGPLGAVRMSAEYLLRTDRLDANAMRAAVRIASSTDRMTGYVKDLLDFAQTLLGAGLPIARTMVSLEQVCQDVADEVRAAHPQADIRVDVLASPSACWDKDRLSQLLANLGTNAVVHGGNATPVTITLRQEGDVARIDVHNAGEPIPADELSSLFQPLTKAQGAHEKRRAGSSGLGLGLHIAREIAIAHGGSIEVASDAVEGTTFTVRLPMSSRDARAG